MTTTYEMDKNYSAGECAAARRLIDRILANPDNLQISVYDGEETRIWKSRDRDAILAALGTTGEDLVSFYGNAPLEAHIYLIWDEEESSPHLTFDAWAPRTSRHKDWLSWIEQMLANFNKDD